MRTPIQIGEDYKHRRLQMPWEPTRWQRLVGWCRRCWSFRRKRRRDDTEIHSP